MTAQLTKIKGTDAQAIVCWGTNPGPAVVARNRVQLGITTPLFMSHGVASKKFIELAGDETPRASSCRRAASCGRPDSRPTIRRRGCSGDLPQGIRSKVQGQAVSTFGGHAWDAVNLVAKAIQHGQFRRARRHPRRPGEDHEFVGIGGEFNLSANDHNGLTRTRSCSCRSKNGDWELLK